MRDEERASLAISGDVEPDDLMRPLKWGELHAAMVAAIRQAEIAAHNAAIEKALKAIERHDALATIDAWNDVLDLKLPEDRA